LPNLQEKIEKTMIERFGSHSSARLALAALVLAFAANVWGYATHAAAEPTAAMLSDTCAGCHGTDGASAGPTIPSIAGYPREYLEQVMMQFRNGERPATIMDRIAAGYSDKRIRAIADFFSQLPLENAERFRYAHTETRVSPELAAEGALLQRKCAICHDDDGRGQEADMPRLAGQWLDYLLIQMAGYKSPELDIPQPLKMKRLIKRKSLGELNAIAHFYASQE